MLNSRASGQVQSQREYSINSNKPTQGQNKQITKEELNQLMLFKCKQKFRKNIYQFKTCISSRSIFAGAHFFFLP